MLRNAWLEQTYSDLPAPLLNQVKIVYHDVYDADESNQHLIRGASANFLRIDQGANIIKGDFGEGALWSYADDYDISDSASQFTCYHQSMLRPAFDLKPGDELTTLTPVWASVKNDELYHNPRLSTMYELTIPTGSKLWCSISQNKPRTFDWIIMSGKWRVDGVEEAEFTGYDVRALLQSQDHKSAVSENLGEIIQSAGSNTVEVQFPTWDNLTGYVRQWTDTKEMPIDHQYANWGKEGSEYWLPDGQKAKPAVANPRAHVLHALSELYVNRSGHFVIKYHTTFARTVRLTLLEHLREVWNKLEQEVTYDDGVPTWDDLTRMVYTADEGVQRRARQPLFLRFE